MSGLILGVILLLLAANAVRNYLKGKICCPIMKEDINDTYGDYYSDPDPVVEMRRRLVDPKAMLCHVENDPIK